jgi:hypothetical protein
METRLLTLTRDKAMKSILMAALGTLLSVGLTTVAWAGDNPDADVPSSGSASQLLVTDAPAAATPQDNTEQMNSLANQINQQVSDGDDQETVEVIPLDLPDGLVIRGTSVGGFTLGTEL